MNLFEKYQKKMAMVQAEECSKTTDKTDKTSGRYAVRIYSEVLGGHLWVVYDHDDMDSLRARGISEAVYTAKDIRLLKGASKERLKAVHRVKQVFQNSTVEDSQREP